MIDVIIAASGGGSRMGGIYKQSYDLEGKPVVYYSIKQFSKYGVEKIVVVVPKEKAVFWLDGNGHWHNKHGRFEHKKVIDYFNASIRRDEGGYHVFQATDEFEERVYFPHEGTALFVFDILIDGEGVILVLNTQRKIELNPADLFIQGDDLYVQSDASLHRKGSEPGWDSRKKYPDV